MLIVLLTAKWGYMGEMLISIAGGLFETDAGFRRTLLFLKLFCQLADGDVKGVDVAADIFRQVVDCAQVFFLLDLKQIHPGSKLSQFRRYRRGGKQILPNLHKSAHDRYVCRNGNITFQKA